MKVAVVSEFYPRRHDPVLGIWAHRQALAVRAAGAEVHVVVLHRLVPPLASVRGGPRSFAAATAALARQPRHDTIDGLPVSYVPFVSPMRSRSYASWGAWAAPPLGLALRRLRRRFAFDLVHAHNADPARRRRPPCRPRRAARRVGARRRRAVHGAHESRRRRRGAAKPRRGAARARQQRGHRRAGPALRRRRDAGRAPRDRRARADRGALGHAHDRHGRSPRRAQAPRRRHARRGRAVRAPSDAALPDRRRRPRA